MQDITVQNVAILYHPQRAQAIDEAEWLSAELRARGVSTNLGDGWDREVIERLCCDQDLVVALGGDGTIIHIARLAACFEVPVVGVNLGKVGFLAEMTPETLHQRVEALANGEFWIEKRAMLDVAWQGTGPVQHFLALNEVSVTRGGQAHAVHVKVGLDGSHFVTYTADGVLVSTATGSTAYSLAAGGPILHPEATDLLLTPVAPHLHIGRSTVLPGNTMVSLALATNRAGVMVVDGSDERRLLPDHVVTINRSELVARFARLEPRSYFYTAIADRLK
jgi:NAD+ kinase